MLVCLSSGLAIFRQKTMAGKTTEIHFKISKAFVRAVERQCKVSGRSLRTETEHSLAVILPVASKSQFHVVPKRFDPGPFPCEVKISLAESQREAVETLARARNLSVPEELRQLVLAALEFTDRFSRPSLPLKEESLREKIQRDLQGRAKKLYGRP